jgi:hypothetical protein
VALTWVFVFIKGIEDFKVEDYLALKMLGIL